MSDAEVKLKLHSYSVENLEDSVVEEIKGKSLSYSRPALVRGDFCRYFCKGANCKYCQTDVKYSGSNMAIDGLFSSWITDNILATARPSMESIEKYRVIEQFQRHGIKTIINLQTSGEHAFCGPGNRECGFSYDPCIFMDNAIDYFNFPCEDWGVHSIGFDLDVVKCVQHRLTIGKIAVHCHAGLGRTGVTIGCYLVFNNRTDPYDIVNYIRKKRPGSVQNQLQVNQIIQFANALKPLRTIFHLRDNGTYQFSLQEAILRQKKLTHGNEAYYLNYVPKILFICLLRIFQIGHKVETNQKLFADVDTASSDASVSFDRNATVTNGVVSPSIHLLHFLRWKRKLKAIFKESLDRRFAKKLISFFNTEYSDKEKLLNFKTSLNDTDTSWNELLEMRDVHLHCQLIIDWISDLKFPILRTSDIEVLYKYESEDVNCILMNLESVVGRTLTVFLAFLSTTNLLDKQDSSHLYSIIFSGLTHKNVKFSEVLSDVRKEYRVDLQSRQSDILRRFIDLKFF